MRLDLSSQIVLDRVPQRYYRPENEFELSALTRFEKVPTHIYESSTEASLQIAGDIARKIKEKQAKGENFVLALPGGHSPQTIYSELIRFHKEEGLSFKNVIVFNIYEFYPLVAQSNSNLRLIKESLLDFVDVDPKNIYSPDGFVPKEEILNYCREYEQKIQEVGGIDYLLLGLGRAGNIGINIAGSSMTSQTRLILLDVQSKKEAINTFGSLDLVPPSAVTMGLSTIMKAKEIALIAWGEDKAKSVKDVVEGVVTDAVPASCLQAHGNASVHIDLNAGFELTRINHPWLVTSCDWTSKLIRRAIVWLCFKVNKPILKLTNKDYQDNGLGELLALYGSAYNVNIKIFNDLQHTITGWPGGKPNADDTNRPERAKPYPKTVIVFSPHPDDDVISMGGTFKRLVDQKHDVHVAYQTSGNIAVGDEEVIRYVSLLEDVRSKYDPSNEVMKKKYAEILQYLLHDKKEGDIDTPDILFLKGYIRREEATTACRYVGMDTKNVRFLDLPFYETGRVKKNPISAKDVEIVKAYLSEVKPHEVFVAGDLADPHGTHKVCLDAILAAVDELKGAEWLKDCRFWMYRGAWAEWEIDHIEMAVPISPEELRSKRNAILKHQSQMESAPFLGNDERLFWQRSEDRNKATAELYHLLGLASYEAIEAFVEYHPL
ncbi:glucosamine-6-phosphate deaminase [Dysgonomonas sp. PFB1-18]|uniref:glucosamine-6-phosphate deaminase n=1 Tax=unclassified Dysgonomonas TaxID=2630389 RepID=UPI0024767E57|nr:MULTISPECIES: glucosamine-6-phosphate deaminase [unclassified Dysgonomonas]MDH6310773.1 glucosamine-6-phosphate deaminase [Dysgonomonas sp. PF1-14]MDH6340623.1 glucosamine-6-phosphate deaminase [Dysgonomonas sp. PF1-16]MDH6382270.1 glucosamine-6-phosphate deaminase [Dysgonomonas sp. PFB1-18]MDH6399593.1 glucosamine-6-phosphate deaminase [Dysgonomonas sp. PF1-23]